MKAAQINAYGGSEVLEIKDVSLPGPQPNQILVDVHAAAVNPFDVTILSGIYKDSVPLEFPVTPGGDFAGRVMKAGSDVKDLKAGDDIYGTALVLSGGSGSFAEKALVKATNAALMPRSVNFEEAAASVLAGVSALQAIEEHMGLQSGQKILIHGGAGGIGHMAIQLAKSLGAYVAATASGDDAEFISLMGADKAVDYRTQTFENTMKDFDAVLDTVGGEVMKRSFTVLKKGGVLVSLKGKPSEELAHKHAVRIVGQGTRTNRRRLERLTALIDGGKIKVHIDREFPLDRIKEAIDHQKKGRPRGKIAIRVA